MRFRLMLFLAVLAAAFACNDPTAVEHDTSPGQFTAVAAGDDHACALDTLSRAWCWGSNHSGQTGVSPAGCVTCSTRPHLVETTLRFSSITAGGRHTCGLTSDGVAYCWGEGSFEQLGAGTIGSCSVGATCTSSPTLVLGGFKFKSITAGSYGTCAITDANVGKCWGYQTFNSSLIFTTPTTVRIPNADSTWKSLGRTDADFSGCGITMTDVAVCWGSNTYGQVGVGAVSTVRVSPTAISLPSSFKSVANGRLFACALTINTEVYCWGRSTGGSLGLGGDAASTTCAASTSAVCFPTPIKVAGTRHYTSLSVGRSHVCGIELETSEPYCWGENLFGAIGAPTIIRPDETAPSPIPSAPGLQLKSVSVGSQFTCGVNGDRNVYCWGSNLLGQLGVAGYDRGGIRSSSAPIIVR